MSGNFKILLLQNINNYFCPTSSYVNESPNKSKELEYKLDRIFDGNAAFILRFIKLNFHENES